MNICIEITMKPRAKLMPQDVYDAVNVLHTLARDAHKKRPDDMPIAVTVGILETARDRLLDLDGVKS